MSRYVPLYMQEGSYPAQFDRLFLSDVTRQGSILLSGAGAYLVSQHAAGANMSVDVQPGRIAVAGTDSPNQGSYVCWSDGVENPVVAASPPAGQSRVDLVVAQVRDDTVIGGGNNDFLVTVVEGTAAATGSQGAPPLPHSAVLLAQIAIGPQVTSIVNANITDGRPSVLATPQPPGSLQAWLGDSTQPPPGWTVGDGRPISRTGIGANLFSMWGTRFGTGDGLTTFNVPDVRGLLPVFFGGGIGLGMGATGGASQVALGKGNIPSMNHVHGTNAEGNSSYQTIYTTPVGGQQYGIPYASGPALNVTFYPAHVTQTTDPGGSSSPFSIVPPVIGVVPLLKL